MASQILSNIEEKMHKTAEGLQQELLTIRTGRATPGLIEHIKVEYAGALIPLNQVASLSVPEPMLIAVQPFDPSLSGAIEKAIQAANLGLNPNNDGKMIRIPIPPLTDERRKELSKVVHKLAEESRNGVRQARRDANDQLKKMLKNKNVSEDEERRALEHVQELTNEHVKSIDDVQEKKDDELLNR